MANGWRMLTDAYPGDSCWGRGEPRGFGRSTGSTYEKPYTAMREYLDAMDRAPSSAAEPEVTPRLVLAALGPKMLELAAERAHGVHPYFVPVEHTAFARQRLGPGPVLAVEQTVVLESDPSEARRVARGFALDYLQTENYARNLKRVGWTDADVAGQGSDALIDAVVAWGDVDRIAVRVQAAPRRRRRPRLHPGGRRGRARPVPPAAARTRARRCSSCRSARPQASPNQSGRDGLAAVAEAARGAPAAGRGARRTPPGDGRSWSYRTSTSRWNSRNRRFAYQAPIQARTHDREHQR
jgi:hypothetical protein